MLQIVRKIEIREKIVLNKLVKKTDENQPQK